MGTLFDQQPRDEMRKTTEDVENFVEQAVEIAKRHGVSVADVIAAKHDLELERRNNLSVWNGDTHDEQLAGFGELIKRFLDLAEERP